FGPFALSVSERLLTKGGESLHLSARAVDILIALVSNSSQPLSKRELMARVWPDATVGENSLRFHILQPSESAWRWGGRRTVHHHTSWAGLLLRSANFTGQ